MLNVFKTVIQYFGRTLNIYLYIFICFHIAIYLLDVQTFKIHQMKRIEKTNLTIVVIWLYVHMFHSKSRKTGSKYSNRNKSMTHETEKPQS